MSTKKILSERAKTHGSFEANAQMSQALKELLATGGTSLSDIQREAIDMIALKLSRITTGNPNIQDHWLDISGYATLAANALED